MTNEQLYLSIGLPMAFNAVLLGILIAYVNAKFEAVTARFEAVRSDLLRVEGVLDARLKHLEEKVH